MKEKDAKLIAAPIIEKYLGNEWGIEIREKITGRSKKRGTVRLVGLCDRTNQNIVFEQAFLLEADTDQMVILTTHEIAHALTPDSKGHDDTWYSKFIELWDKEKVNG